VEEAGALKPVHQRRLRHPPQHRHQLCTVQTHADELGPRGDLLPQGAVAPLRLAPQCPQGRLGELLGAEHAHRLPSVEVGEEDIGDTGVWGQGAVPIIGVGEHGGCGRVPLVLVVPPTVELELLVDHSMVVVVVVRPGVCRVVVPVAPSWVPVFVS